MHAELHRVLPADAAAAEDHAVAGEHGDGLGLQRCLVTSLASGEHES